MAPLVFLVVLGCNSTGKNAIKLLSFFYMLAVKYCYLFSSILNNSKGKENYLSV